MPWFAWLVLGAVVVVMFAWLTVATTTADGARGLLIRVTRDEGYYRVSDLIGLRYGHGASLEEALTEYAHQVDDIRDLAGRLGPAVAAEAEAYRKALS